MRLMSTACDTVTNETIAGTGGSFASPYCFSGPIKRAGN